MSAVIGAELEPGVRLAGDVAAAAAVAFDDLPLLEAADKARRDLVLLVAAADELRERLFAGALDFEARQDLALDVTRLAGRVQSFALTVLG